MLLRSRCKDGCRCEDATHAAIWRSVASLTGNGTTRHNLEDQAMHLGLSDFAPVAHSTPVRSWTSESRHWAAGQVQGILRTDSATSLQKIVRFEDDTQSEEQDAQTSTTEFSTGRLRVHGGVQNGSVHSVSSSRSHWQHSEDFSEDEEEVEHFTGRETEWTWYGITGKRKEARNGWWGTDSAPPRPLEPSPAAANLSQSVGMVCSSMSRCLYRAVCLLLVMDVWLLSRVSKARRRWVLALLLPLLLWACGPPLLPGFQRSWSTTGTWVAQDVRRVGSAVWTTLGGLAAFVPAVPSWSPQKDAVAQSPCMSDAYLEETVRSLLEQRMHHLEEKWSQEARELSQGTDQEFERLRHQLKEQESMARELLVREQCKCCEESLAGTLDSRILVKLDEVLGDARALRHSAGLTEELREREARLEESVALLKQQVAAARDAAIEASRLAALPREAPKQQEVPMGHGDDATRIVREALRLYDADKTGMADYALESGGGSVVNTRCTETYTKGAIQYSMLGISLWTFVRTARTAIQPQMHPGECWAFQGSQGHLVVQLARRIHPTSFTVEHLPKELATSGSLDSAPRDFHILGLDSETDQVGKLLGKYTYDIDGEPLQHFIVQDPDPGSFRFIEMKILSNHGHLEYTCLYRLRVHGVPTD